MFGIRTVKITGINHFHWWIVCWLSCLRELIGILSFGYLCIDWAFQWYNHFKFKSDLQRAILKKEKKDAL